MTRHGTRARSGFNGHAREINNHGCAAKMANCPNTSVQTMKMGLHHEVVVYVPNILPSMENYCMHVNFQIDAMIEF